ncbi:2-iminobutanoate/2-iminopropanoate deaminase-like [Liolophura sinensis]|uniref:2-iminobutanoate/2-iminopropanoate deaminase-like n=1 Tax=Liolophura sinensis TaxID=3198878 RepID=UPI0031587539
MSQVIRRIISTPKAPKAIGPYSQAVAVDKTLYVSGQLGLNPESMELPEDVATQTKQALQNIGSILESANSSFSKVVKTTILLADINDYATVNSVYGTFFSAPFPARAAYQVANLPKLAKVEIEAIAIIGDVKDQ